MTIGEQKEERKEERKTQTKENKTTPKMWGHMTRVMVSVYWSISFECLLFWRDLSIDFVFFLIMVVSFVSVNQSLPESGIPTATMVASSQTHCKKWTWSRPNSLVSFSKKWTWPRPNSQMSFTTCLDWVVFYRSTPGYQVPCLDWVVFYRSTPRYQVRFSKSVRSFCFVVVIRNTHRQRRKSSPIRPSNAFHT